MGGKTRIVCTIGPASRTEQQLRALIEAGMDVARLNFSHGTHEEHLTTIRHLQAARERTGRQIAVLQDLQGPKIRIGELKTDHVQLVSGRRVIITTEQVAGTSERLPTSYGALPQDVRPGDIILLDDGRVRLRVTEVRGEEVVCTIVIGGKLLPHKGMNLPGTAVNMPSVTEKDLADLAFGIAHEVDHVALSFVRRADDIRALRAAMVGLIPKETSLPIVAKIEKPQAVANIDEIIAEADGIMVARGDLGVEMPPEEVPVLQKMIIRKCNAVGKPVIIATQMLESMINNPSPTRAEASDVANAVVDGADAVMLSGETSIGKYPLEAVGMMQRIIQRVESEHVVPWHAAEGMAAGVEGRVDALGRAACVLAEQMKAAAIVVVTRSGETARAISRYRPPTPIIAVTDSTNILRRLGLVWGIEGMIAEGLNDSSDKALHRIQQGLLASGLVQAGAFVVLLGGQPFLARGSTNFIKIARIE